ncbi:DNA mismatch repair protein MutS [Enterobacter cancerogenus]|uniref:DNA mismatch repair protein MutS n=1 Tax=Enterobacter cancerogenus TaxID=69218 RepID=A0A484Z9R5_9ENTR|nr:DNA mismatch repair protein MutS [Enterobacter cancerogenus]
MIKRARQKLRELESLSPNAAATQIDGTQMSLLVPAEETSPAVEALENLDPDSPDATPGAGVDLSVEESGLVLGFYCRVAASPYPAYKTYKPGKRLRLRAYFYNNGGIVGTCGASSISFCVIRNASG